MPDSNVIFEDYSVRVKAVISQKLKNFVEEAGGELEAEVADNTPTEKTQLYASWKYITSQDGMSVSVGSPLEESLWNEYGTGSHAEARHGGTGKGRQGWWVYVKDQPRSASNSKVYSSKEEAEKGAKFLRSKGLDAVATNGEVAHFTLYNSFQNKKSAIKRRAEEIMKGVE